MSTVKGPFIMLILTVAPMASYVATPETKEPHSQQKHDCSPRHVSVPKVRKILKHLGS